VSDLLKSYKSYELYSGRASTSGCALNCVKNPCIIQGVAQFWKFLKYYGYTFGAVNHDAPHKASYSGQDQQILFSIS
jgi:hypothetical protein